MARVYKRIIKITGYGEFEKIVNVSTNGTFSVLCPEFIVKDGITQMEHLYAQNLKDLEKKFNEAKNQFEDLQYDFKEVILYRIYEKKDSSISANTKNENELLRLKPKFDGFFGGSMISIEANDPELLKRMLLLRKDYENHLKGRFDYYQKNNKLNQSCNKLIKQLLTFS